MSGRLHTSLAVDCTVTSLGYCMLGRKDASRGVARHNAVMSELNGDRSAWLRCYRCWSQNLEIQIHYDAIRRVDPDTGIPAEGVDEVQESAVQCLDCMHDQPHLTFQDDRVVPIEDRWERMVAGTPWVASCTVTVDQDRIESCAGPEAAELLAYGAFGPAQLSIRSWSTVTVQEATQGVPATIRSQRSSIGTTRSSWKVRWGWSCMQSRHWTTDSCTSSIPSAGMPVSGSTRRIAS